MREKVLFIAKPNIYTKNIFLELIEYFNVQLSNVNENMVKEALELFYPEVIILFRETQGTSEENIIKNMCKTNKYKNTVIIVMGDKMEGLEEYDIKYVNKAINSNDLKNMIVNSLYEIKCKKSTNEDKKHILVVDDYSVTLRSMKLMLQDKYRISIANSIETTKSSLEREIPDLVLLDYDMPEYDGKAILKMIREDEKTKDLPVVFLSAIDDFDKITDVMELKPQGYILKSSSKQRILTEIEYCFYEIG